MPRNNSKCCSEVKDIFKKIHKNCNKDKRSPIEVSGSFLNERCFLVEWKNSDGCEQNFTPFDEEPRKVHKICQNLYKIIENKKPSTPPVQKKKYKDHVATSTPSVILPPESSTRSDRYQRRMEARHLAEVKEQEENIHEDEEADSILISVEKSPEEVERLNFKDNVIKLAKEYRKPFRKLRWRKRVERVDSIACSIVACCINKVDLKNEGIEYIIGNNHFANDVLNVVNFLKDRLESKLKVNLRSIQYPDACDLPDSDEDNDNTFSNEKERDVAYAIMGESSSRGYERIRKKFNEVVTDGTQLPSVYKLNQAMPIKCESLKIYVPSDEKKEQKKEDVLLGNTSVSDYLKFEDEALSMFSKGNSFERRSSGSTNDNVYIGAKLQGNFVDYVELMKDKLMKKNIGNIVNGEDLIVISSFDGAEVSRTKKNITGVISFSSSLVAPKLVQKKNILSGSSLNICTWMQLVAQEEYSILERSLVDYFEKRKELSQGSIHLKDLPNSKIWCYDVHDGKMLYSLLQYSMWNRKHSPFIMCKYKRREGLNNDSHECTMFDDETYKNLWIKSKDRWEYKKKKDSRRTPSTLRIKSYENSHHRDWCDSKNFGVTHYGIHPDQLHVSSMRFDVFHLKCAIIRRFMSYLRNLMLKQYSGKVKKFTNEILRSFWSDFHVYCWNNSINFSKFQGNDLVLFVINSPKITEFLQNSLIFTEEIKNYCKGLSLLKKIFTFTSISYIENGTEYSQKMRTFNCDVKDLYKYGKTTYLRGNEYDETFYFHCLAFYLPKLARITFERHNLGLGIFTMQGFERRNKESKNCFKRFTTNNKKSDVILVNNLRRLLQVFIHDINAY